MLVLALVALSGCKTKGELSISPESGTLTVATSSPGVALRDPTVQPIVAIFDPPAFTTSYTAPISNPDPQRRLTIMWSGPNCGTWAPQVPMIEIGADIVLSMALSHPHPPCAQTTNHLDVTVTLSIAYERGTLICVYNGSESGKGPECRKL